MCRHRAHPASLNHQSNLCHLLSLSTLGTNYPDIFQEGHQNQNEQEQRSSSGRCVVSTRQEVTPHHRSMTSRSLSPVSKTHHVSLNIYRALLAWETCIYITLVMTHVRWGIELRRGLFLYSGPNPSHLWIIRSMSVD